MQKQVMSAAEAVADIADGARVMIGGFGVIQGWPASLIQALRDRGSRDLTLVCNTPGVGPTSPQQLAESGQIGSLIASYAAYPTQRTVLEEQIRAGRVKVELVPQGTLIERVRAAGAGLAGFYTPTGVGTDVAAGKEVRELDGRPYVFERALSADFALVRAAVADRHGNLLYRGAGRNYNPVFATGARVTIAEVDEIVEAGAIDPEAVVTPGVFVDRIVRCERPLDLARVRQLSMRFGKKWDFDTRERPVGPRGIPPDLMARKVAVLLRHGEYVNLGLGIPTLVSSYVEPEQSVTLHAENGMVGFGPLVAEGEMNADYYNASGQLVRLERGASFADSCAAFAMVRSGRVSTVVLGGFQVAANGDLANWNVPSTGVGGIGGAMDLAAGSARIVVVMFHMTRDGMPKLVERCSYPLTAAGCVRTIVTDLAVIDVDEAGFLLREVAPGVSVDEVRAVTGAPLRVAPDVGEMSFG
ncbi:MAG: 3-oxoacid CoA-transferase subunit A [Deltaproteobacteria bacterium]|nr:3-oxoacid CoA-transferase subunit A [Deltaproteobacteria bacterium]